MAEHPQFVRWQEQAAGEAEQRATGHWEGDKRRLANLHLLFITMPR